MVDAAETPEELYALGKRFYMPSSGVADPLLAIYYFQKSAEAGYVPAQRVLGTCYLEGKLTAVDYKKAHYWLSAAAKENDPQAAITLAWMYARGLGVQQDYDLAWQLLSMECVKKTLEGRKLKEDLKASVRKPFSEIMASLTAEETKRRGAYSSSRVRFIQPWETPGRMELEREEFAIWLALQRGQITPQQAQGELLLLLQSYYDQKEAAHPN